MTTMDDYIKWVWSQGLTCGLDWVLRYSPITLRAMS